MIRELLAQGQADTTASLLGGLARLEQIRPQGFRETRLGKFALAGSPLQVEFETAFQDYGLRRKPVTAK